MATLQPVGNDVVDLGLPENRDRSKDRRFLERVFTREEQEGIARAACPDTLLWALWAAKEAAFKAVGRADPAVGSVPRRYPVLLDGRAGDCPAAGTGAAGDETENPVDSLSGMVHTLHGALPVHVLLTGDWVHALAAGTKGALARLIHQVDRLDEPGAETDPSRAVRARLARRIADRWGCRVEAIEVRKNPRNPDAPCLFLHGRELPVAVSLSHDGRFTAFALDLSP
jgi:phosphopantetheinyl transferase (holo-ACP synthase)